MGNRQRYTIKQEEEYGETGQRVKPHRGASTELLSKEREGTEANKTKK